MVFVRNMRHETMFEIPRRANGIKRTRGRTIKSGGRGFDSRRDQRFFSLPRAISHFLTRANAQWGIHGFTAELIL